MWAEIAADAGKMICTLNEKARLVGVSVVCVSVSPEDICVVFKVIWMRACMRLLWGGVAVRVGFQLDAHSALAVVVVSCPLGGRGADGANCFTRRLG